MNVLILGSGGREHALAWKIKQSPNCENLFIGPGNGGTGEVGQNIQLNPEDSNEVTDAVLANNIDLVVVGPEAPLVVGLVDKLKADDRLKDLLIVGPEQAGAQLEGSKEFAKDFMYRYGIPTAKAKVFDESNIEEGYAFLENNEPPYVLKADGLAAGKGVLITSDLEEAKENLRELIVEKKFGEASARVLVEQFLDGIELSVFVLTDGKDYLLLPEAKDYKRIGEGDTGPNTGGMGAISPVSFAKPHFMEKIETRIIRPTIAGLEEDGIPFCGFIFFGLINVKNDPYVIEYNVRMGDPETEAVLPRVKSDLLEHLVATAKGELDDQKLEVVPYSSVTVMMVSEGYPGAYEKGRKITMDANLKGVIPFHAGTKLQDGELLTNGGRVITLTALGKNMLEAMTKCYDATNFVKWEGKNLRKDIGQDLKEYG